MTKSAKRTLQQLGGTPREIADELREFSATARVFSDEKQDLINKYPSKWIGVYKSEVVGASTHLNVLMSQLAKKNIPASDTVLRFISKTQRTLIL